MTMGLFKGFVHFRAQRIISSYQQEYVQNRIAMTMVPSEYDAHLLSALVTEIH